MKTIDLYLIWLSSLIALSNGLFSPLLGRNREIVEPTPSKICAARLAWLQSTVEVSKTFPSRQEVAELLKELTSYLTPCDATKEIVDSLRTLLQKEKSKKILGYLVIVAGRLRIKKVAQAMLSLFYQYHQNQSLCLSMIDAFKMMKVT